jgi:hypothetical protein
MYTVLFATTGEESRKLLIVAVQSIAPVAASNAYNLLSSDPT